MPLLELLIQAHLYENMILSCFVKDRFPTTDTGPDSELLILCPDINGMLVCHIVKGDDCNQTLGYGLHEAPAHAHPVVDH